MTKKVEQYLLGIFLTIGVLCILALQSSIQDFGIAFLEPIVTKSSSLAKYFTPDRMKQYFSRCVSVLLQLEIICLALYVVWKYTKNRLAILQGEYAPYILLIVGSLLLHAFLILNWGDDVYFRDSIQRGGVTLIEFLQSRYNHWSSRFIIEAFLVCIAYVPLLWIVLDTAVMVLIAYSLNQFLPTTNKKSTYILVCFIFIYPFIDMRTAGWIATTMNYTWPLAFGLYAMLSIKTILEDKPLTWYQATLSVLALLYAANHEQMGLLLAGFFLVFSFYQLVIQKKIHWFLVLQTFLSIASIVFILTAPGNEVRATWTIQEHFPAYTTLSLLQKTELGFSSTFYALVMKPNLSFLLFGVFIVIAALTTERKRWFVIFSAFPLFVSFVFGHLGPILGKIIPGIGTIRSGLTITGTNPTFLNPLSLIPNLIFMLVCGSIIYSLYILFTDKKEFFLIVLILGAGLASRVAMAFTPSIWFSEGRTFIFLYFALIYCSMRLYQIIVASSKVRCEQVFVGFVTVSAMCAWLFHIMVGSVTHLIPFP